MNTNETILVIGACGQIGVDLTRELRILYGESNVIASDIKLQKKPDSSDMGLFEQLDILDNRQFYSVIKKYGITQVYHLAAMLSAKAEEDPINAWRLNMESLLNVLQAAREFNFSKVFWPSSIAVFGKTTPRENTPQNTIMEPDTVYGISKLAGERWCDYYFNNYGVDVRSVRYPGLISYKTKPGGGTTDYAVEIFYGLAENNEYACYLGEDTGLPMMYMPDATRAAIELMEADMEQLSVHSSYNISGCSFTPGDITAEIRKQFPDFNVIYNPDFRQKIADSWPESIDDECAQKDWNWNPQYDLSSMVDDMLANINVNNPTNA